MKTTRLLSALFALLALGAAGSGMTTLVSDTGEEPIPVCEEIEGVETCTEAGGEGETGGEIDGEIEEDTAETEGEVVASVEDDTATRSVAQRKSSSPRKMAPASGTDRSRASTARWAGRR